MWNRSHHPLETLPLLKGLPRSSVDRLAALMTPVRLTDGQIIARQGRHSEQFVLVEHGALQVTRDGATVTHLGPGEFAGEMSLLGDGTANATVTAVGDTTVYVSSSREFAALLRSSLGESITRTAAVRAA